MSSKFRSNVAINKQLVAAQAVEDLFSVLRSSWNDLNLVNCVTGLQRLAKLAFDKDGQKGSHRGSTRTVLDQDLTLSLLELTARKIHSESENCEPRHLSGALWAAAKLSAGSEELLRAVYQGILEKCPDFKPQELSNALWATAKLSPATPGLESLVINARTALVRTVQASIQKNLSSVKQDWSPQAVSNVTWALGSLGLADRELIGSLLGLLPSRVEEFNTQEVANMLWSFAKLKEQSSGEESDGDVGGGLLGDLLSSKSPGLQALVMRMERGNLLKHATCQQLANTVWGSAKLGMLEGPLFAAVRQRLPGFAARMNAQEVSMCAWALANCSQDAASLLRETMASSRSTTGSMSARQVATLLWAAAKLGVVDSESTGVAAGRFVDVQDGASPRDLANTAWALAKLEIRNAEAVAAVCGAVCREAAAGRGGCRFSPQHITVLLHSLAALGQRDGAAIEFLVAEAERRLGEFNPRDITNTASALALMGRRHEPVVHKLADRAAARLRDFNSQELLKFLSAYRATGAKHPALEAAVQEPRELSYAFPELGMDVVLTAGTPRRFGKRERRVDDSCGGGGRGNTGVALWEGSYVLAEWLSRQRREGEQRSLRPLMGAIGLGGTGPFDGERRCAVELGAGLGLPSIVAGALGFRVVATDGDASALELLQRNLDRNGLRGRARAAQLAWGHPDPAAAAGLGSPPDLILASDVVYGNDPAKWRALVHTMASLAGPGTLIALANMQRYPIHHPLSEAVFLTEALGPGFHMARLPTDELHPEYRRAGAGSCAVFLLRRKDGASPRPALPEPRAGDCPAQPRKRRRGGRAHTVVACGSAASVAGMLRAHRAWRRR